MESARIPPRARKRERRPWDPATGFAWQIFHTISIVSTFYRNCSAFRPGLVLRDVPVIDFVTPTLRRSGIEVNYQCQA